MKYAFDPDALHAIAGEASAEKDREAAFNRILSRVEELAPGKINHELEWLENIAGQALGKMAILYGSLREYLILFGTPFHVSSSHSGRYSADVWDIVIAGKMECLLEGEIDWSTYHPGDMARLDRKVIKYYRTIDQTWMLEYGRGNIPGMLGFGVFGHQSLTRDRKLTRKQVKGYGKLVLKNLFS